MPFQSVPPDGVKIDVVENVSTFGDPSADNEKSSKVIKGNELQFEDETVVLLSEEPASSA